MSATTFSTRVNVKQQLEPAAKVGDATLTVAEVRAGLMTSNAGAAANYTTPSGGAMDSPSAGLAINDSFDFTIINLGSVDYAFLIPGSGTTLVGLDAVGVDDGVRSTSGTFRFRKTAASTFVIYRVS